MSIGEGVYFIRGTFAQVQSETIVLEQYNNTPSYRIGFDVQEDFISADEDPSLNDNSVNSKFSPIICKHKALEGNRLQRRFEKGWQSRPHLEKRGHDRWRQELGHLREFLV